MAAGREVGTKTPQGAGLGKKPSEPDPELLKNDPDERDAIQNEPEIDLLKIPPIFDRRNRGVSQPST